MNGFFGTHECLLDRKKAGRVTLPRDFRNELPVNPENEDTREVALLQSPEESYPTIFGFPKSILQVVKNIQFRLDDLFDDGNNIASDILANTRILKTEATGRLSMPADFITFADFGDKVQFCGQGDFFEIWPEGGFTSYRAARKDCVTRRILQRVAGAGADRDALEMMFSGGSA